MRKTFTYRIYPTRGQETLLRRALEECRWTYNETLATRKNTYEKEKKSLSYFDTNALLPAWKEMRPSLRHVYAQCLQDVGRRVDFAFQGFFRRVKSGEIPGYPRFRGKDRYDSFTYPQYPRGVRLEDKTLTLSKIGSIAVEFHRPVEGEIKTVTIKRGSTGKWFAFFSCDSVPAKESFPEPEAEAIGVDLGLNKFAFLSNGESVKNPRFFRKEQEALAKVQRRLSRQKKGTPERAKVKKSVALVHERIANKRADFAHKLSRSLVNRFEMVVFEKLNVKGMVENGSLSKSIADVAWSQLVQFAAYKAEEAGRHVVLVNPRNTSKACSGCGTLVEKGLWVRVHSCPSCGLKIDRDFNAALNILRLGLQSQATGAPEGALLPRSRAALAAAE